MTSGVNLCRYAWCERELRINLGRLALIRHRGTVGRLLVDGNELLVTVTVIDGGPPLVGVQTTSTSLDDVPVTLATIEAEEAKRLAFGVLNVLDEEQSPSGGEDDDDGERWDPDTLGRRLRDGAERERVEHGPYLRMGPFDDAPFGLADSITDHFTASEGATDRGTSWLLGMLASRHVGTGETDRDIAREIVDVLGPDAAQVVGGWLFRAK